VYKYNKWYQYEQIISEDKAVVITQEQEKLVQKLSKIFKLNRLNIMRLFMALLYSFNRIVISHG